MTTIRVLRVLSVFVSSVATAFVTMWSGYVDAGVLTINFPTDLADNSPLPVFHNSTADGFRISPRCHFDNVVNVGGLNPLPGIGWDSAGCGNFPSGFNSAQPSYCLVLVS